MVVIVVEGEEVAGVLREVEACAEVEVCAHSSSIPYHRC